MPSNNLKKWKQFHYFHASNGIWDKSQQTAPWTKFLGMDERGKIDLVTWTKFSKSIGNILHEYARNMDR